MHPCLKQAINVIIGSESQEEELIPGAFQESHDTLESNLKINNKVIEPNV